MADMSDMSMSQVDIPEKKIRKSRKRAVPKINDYNDNMNMSIVDIVDDQNRAYYESLEKDMEKDITEQIAEIERQTKLKELQEESERQKHLEFKMEELAKIEKEKNQPSREELRQRRIKFYENK